MLKKSLIFMFIFGGCKNENKIVVGSVSVQNEVQENTGDIIKLLDADIADDLFKIIGDMSKERYTNAIDLIKEKRKNTGYEDARLVLSKKNYQTLKSAGANPESKYCLLYINEDIKESCEKTSAACVTLSKAYIELKCYLLFILDEGYIRADMQSSDFNNIYEHCYDDIKENARSTRSSRIYINLEEYIKTKFGISKKEISEGKITNCYSGNLFLKGDNFSKKYKKFIKSGGKK